MNDLTLPRRGSTARSRVTPLAVRLAATLLAALTLSACVRDESDPAAANASPAPPTSTPPTTNPPPTTPPPDTTPPPVDPNQPSPPPQQTDVQRFQATLYPKLRDPANFCVGCHGAAQIPTFAVDDVMTAYNVITTQQKVNLANPALSRVYLRPAVDRHNCGANASCDRVAADFLAAIQAWANQQPSTPPPAPQSLKSSVTSLPSDFNPTGAPVTLSFDVSAIVGGNARVEMLAGQVDAASYLFAQPKLVTDTTGVKVKNIRIAVNDAVPVAAQAFRRVDTMVTQSGTELSRLGAVIPVALGASQDKFHLEFEALGNKLGSAETVAPSAPPAPAADVPEPALGVRSFSKMSDTMSALTGVSRGAAAVSTLYTDLRDSLPATDDILAFGSAQQVAIQRLATAYCGAIVTDTTACTNFFGACTIAVGARGTVADRIYDRLLGVNLASQPDKAAVNAELVDELNDLGCTNGCTGATATTALQATCAAALSSAAVTIN